MCIAITDLPPPETSRTGWPWTESCRPLPAKMPSGQDWPKISIITPSYNQGQYLEETIRSVLLQGYPALEYFIVDGGSTDNSVAIIKKYERWLDGWVSERDEGQCDAINKGFRLCTGEVFNWLCSDDLLLPGALHTVGRGFREEPKCDVVAGSCVGNYEQEDRSELKYCDIARFDRLPFIAPIWQPSCFFRRSLIGRSPLVKPEMNYCMDRELWAYLHSQKGVWKWTNEALSVYRFTGQNKSVTGRTKIIAELDSIYRTYIPEAVPLTFWLRKLWLPLVSIQKRHAWAPVRLTSRLMSGILSGGLRAAYPADRLKALQREFYVYEMW